MSDKHKACQSHCCKQHGCKYSHDDCPVVLGEEIQEFPCEECGNDEMDALHREERTERISSLNDGKIVLDRAEWLKIFQDNVRKAEQITSLQRELTLKEELLRAHRRLELTPVQATVLEDDLRKTTEDIRKKYAEAPRGSAAPIQLYLELLRLDPEEVYSHIGKSKEAKKAR